MDADAILLDEAWTQGLNGADEIVFGPGVQAELDAQHRMFDGTTSISSSSGSTVMSSAQISWTPPPTMSYATSSPWAYEGAARTLALTYRHEIDKTDPKHEDLDGDDDVMTLEYAGEWVQVDLSRPAVLTLGELGFPAGALGTSGARVTVLGRLGDGGTQPSEPWTPIQDFAIPPSSGTRAVLDMFNGEEYTQYRLVFTHAPRTGFAVSAVGPWRGKLAPPGGAEDISLVQLARYFNDRGLVHLTEYDRTDASLYTVGIDGVSSGGGEVSLASLVGRRYPRPEDDLPDPVTGSAPRRWLVRFNIGVDGLYPRPGLAEGNADEGRYHAPTYLRNPATGPFLVEVLREGGVGEVEVRKRAAEAGLAVQPQMLRFHHEFGAPARYTSVLRIKNRWGRTTLKTVTISRPGAGPLITDAWLADVRTPVITVPGVPRKEGGGTESVGFDIYDAYSFGPPDLTLYQPANLTYRRDIPIHAPGRDAAQSGGYIWDPLKDSANETYPAGVTGLTWSIVLQPAASYGGPSEPQVNMAELVPTTVGGRATRLLRLRQNFRNTTYSVVIRAENALTRDLALNLKSQTKDFLIRVTEPAPPLPSTSPANTNIALEVGQRAHTVSDVYANVSDPVGTTDIAVWASSAAPGTGDNLGYNLTQDSGALSGTIVSRSSSIGSSWSPMGTSKNTAQVMYIANLHRNTAVTVTVTARNRWGQSSSYAYTVTEPDAPDILRLLGDAGGNASHTFTMDGYPIHSFNLSNLFMEFVTSNLPFTMYYSESGYVNPSGHPDYARITSSTSTSVQVHQNYSNTAWTLALTATNARKSTTTWITIQESVPPAPMVTSTAISWHAQRYMFGVGASSGHYIYNRSTWWFGETTVDGYGNEMGWGVYDSTLRSSGFTYELVSSSGVGDVEPVVSGASVVWTPPLVLGSRSATFKVTNVYNESRQIFMTWYTVDTPEMKFNRDESGWLRLWAAEGPTAGGWWHIVREGAFIATKGTLVGLEYDDNPEITWDPTWATPPVTVTDHVLPFISWDPTSGTISGVRYLMGSRVPLGAISAKNKYNSTDEMMSGNFILPALSTTTHPSRPSGTVGSDWTVFPDLGDLGGGSTSWHPVTQNIEIDWKIDGDFPQTRFYGGRPHKYVVSYVQGPPTTQATVLIRDGREPVAYNLLNYNIRWPHGVSVAGVDVGMFDINEATHRTMFRFGLNDGHFYIIIDTQKCPYFEHVNLYTHVHFVTTTHHIPFPTMWVQGINVMLMEGMKDRTFLHTNAASFIFQSDVYLHTFMGDHPPASIGWHTSNQARIPIPSLLGGGLIHQVADVFTDGGVRLTNAVQGDWGSVRWYGANFLPQGDGRTATITFDMSVTRDTMGLEDDDGNLLDPGDQICLAFHDDNNENSYHTFVNFGYYKSVGRPDPKIQIGSVDDVTKLAKNTLDRAYPTYDPGYHDDWANTPLPLEDLVDKNGYVGVRVQVKRVPIHNIEVRVWMDGISKVWATSTNGMYFFSSYTFYIFSRTGDAVATNMVRWPFMFKG